MRQMTPAFGSRLGTVHPTWAEALFAAITEAREGSMDSLLIEIFGSRGQEYIIRTSIKVAVPDDLFDRVQSAFSYVGDDFVFRARGFSPIQNN